MIPEHLHKDKLTSVISVDNLTSVISVDKLTSVISEHLYIRDYLLYSTGYEDNAVLYDVHLSLGSKIIFTRRII